MKNTLLIVAFLNLCNGAWAQDTTAADSSSTWQVYEIPDWAPYNVLGIQTRYYYFPDKQIYYELKSKMFIFNETNGWTYSPRLPFTRFGEFDLSQSNVVPLMVEDQWIFKKFEEHVAAYPTGYRYQKE